MKRQLLLFTYALCLSPYAFPQEYGWQKIEPASIPETSDFSDVFFTNDDTGWITTSTTSNIYKTTDGGQTFETQTTPLGATSAIHMLDTVNGYSGGQGGWVYKTDDGGLNWNMLASMGHLLDISFPFNADSNNPVGYASGNSGQVWKITTTLTNLNSPSSSTFSGISAPAVDNVWVCGGNRIYYYNGVEFTSQGGPTGTFNDIHFINSLEGWLVGDLGVIGRTTNGGLEWVTLSNPDTQNRSLYGVFFLDSDYGWAVGSDGVILHTTDGGTSWVIEAAGLTTAFLRGVLFTSPTNGYVVGNGKTLLKYSEVFGIRENPQTSDFELFPNPVSDKFEVRLLGSARNDIGAEFEVGAGKVELYELSGKKLLEENIEKDMESIEIDVSQLESGMYLCKITIGKRSSAKKIVKE